MKELGKVYRCLKEGDKAVVIEENEKFKTCLIKFIDSEKVINITTGTLHNRNLWEEDTTV